MLFSAAARKPLRGLTATLAITLAGAALAVAQPGAALASTTAAAPAISAATNYTAPGRLAPAQGLLFGAARGAGSGMSLVDAMTDMEATVGRTMDLHRTYQVWDDRGDSAAVKWDIAGGRVPALSIMAKLSNGNPVPWGRIASGAEDTRIAAHADALKALGTKVMLTFHHEPEDEDARWGTPADYRAAYRRYVSVFRSRGVSNVEFSWILMANSFNTPRGAAPVADAYYPGDDVVEWLGVDGYNWYNVCQTTRWRTFDEVFSGFRTWAAAHPRPIFIAEYASAEDSAVPGRKAEWIHQSVTSLKAWPQVKAVSWYNTSLSIPGCGWLITTSPSALTAYRQTAQDPYMAPNRLTTGAPTLTDAVIEDVTADSATVAATLNGGNLTTSYHVEYGASTGYGSITSAVTVPGTDEIVVRVKVPGLTALSNYSLRLVATNAAGTAHSADLSATTVAAPATEGVTVPEFLDRSATVAGVVLPNGQATSWYVQYGKTTAYGSSTAPVAAGDGLAPVPAAAVLTGLTPRTTYHARLVAHSAGGTAVSENVTFTTAALPYPLTWWNSARTATAATVNGSVDPNRLATTYRFQYGRTTAYSSSTAPVAVGSGDAAVSVSARLTGLAAGITYHYRIVATSAAGTVYGLDRSFTTARAAAARKTLVGSTTRVTTRKVVPVTRGVRTVR